MNIVSSSLLFLEDSKFVNFVHQKYPMPKEQISKITVAASTLFCFTPHGAQLCSFFVGTLYPVFISCSVLDPSTELVKLESDLHRYWVVWIVATRIEIALSSITAFIPMLYQLKLLAFVLNIYNSFSFSNHLFDNGIMSAFKYCNTQLLNVDIKLVQKDE
tara:strand:- start:23353 stop:23832 length:480 start_codon:yes stop_codon:yes gene_type:complete